MSEKARLAIILTAMLCLTLLSAIWLAHYLSPMEKCVRAYQDSERQETEFRIRRSCARQLNRPGATIGQSYVNRGSEIQGRSIARATIGELGDSLTRPVY